MKNITLAFILIFPCITIAEELCTEYESKIESDHRLHEYKLTKERALESLKSLTDTIEINKSSSWVAVPNDLNLVNGYFMKRQVLQNSVQKDYFCKWLMRQVIYD